MDITFNCGVCGGKLVIDESGASSQVSCPACHSVVTVPPSQGSAAKPSVATVFRNLFLVTAGILLFVLIWAAIATHLAAGSRAELRIVRSKVEELESEAETTKKEAIHQLQDAKQEAARQVQQAKEEAAKILAQAEDVRKQAERIVARDEEKLHTVFGNLRKYQPGRNEVGMQYLSQIEVSGGRIRTYMVNNSYGAVQPNFHILFVNKYGFITEDFHKYWFFDRIKPNETRVDDEAIAFRYGDPTYFTVEFSN